MATKWFLWLACMAWLILFARGVLDESGDWDESVNTSLRNVDFPSTHIGRIHLDLTCPNQLVQLQWAGPKAAEQDTGPFRSSPGAGWGNNDCNDELESNCPDSRCTPKGTRKVEGLMDHMDDDVRLQFVTVIDRVRKLSFHSHPVVPPYPASKGCVRLEPYAAQLIHDNSVVGCTEIVIDGTWSKPPDVTTRSGNRALRNR